MEAPSPPPLSMTLGAIEIGVLLSSALWGFSCVQTYMYVVAPVRDSPFFRSMVGAVFSMESLHMVFIWAYFYHITVIEYGHPSEIASVPWTFNAAFVLHTTISAIVQAFFTYRVWKLSGHLWLAVPAWGVATARVAFSMWAVALLAQDGVRAFASTRWLGDLALILSMCVDIYNTTALAFFLSRAKDGVFSGTSRMLDKILVLTMETGFAVVIVAVFGLISWIVAAESALWIAAILVYARLYSNSFFATLNARAMHARTGAPATSGGGTISEPVFGSPRSGMFDDDGDDDDASATRTYPPAAVRVHVKRASTVEGSSTCGLDTNGSTF